MAENNCKYYKEVKQVSYDSGQTWTNVDPPQYRNGDLYESGSTDCGTVPTKEYRWYDSGEIVCYNDGSYYLAYYQVSTDGGITWTNVEPIETKAGSVIKEYDCDCVVHLTAGNNSLRGITTSNKNIWIYGNNHTITDKDMANYRTIYKAAVGEGIVTIGDYTFSSCNDLVDIVLPNSLQVIEEYAFRWCDKLKCLELPPNLTEIGQDAFISCHSIEDIVIPSGVTDVSCFCDCTSLSSVTMSNNVTKIGTNAFRSCRSLSSITIPSSVTTIGSGAFYNCTSLSSITIPNSVTRISGDAFYNCTSLSSVTIPSSVISMGGWTFRQCHSLTSVTFDTRTSDINFVGYGFFYGCGSLVNVTIPEGITTIGEQMFAQCASLTNITIPSTITKIKDLAFEFCGYGTETFEITILATTPPTLTRNPDKIFPVYSRGFSVKVPAESVYAYRTAQYWSNIANYIQPIT